MGVVPPSFLLDKAMRQMEQTIASAGKGELFVNGEKVDETAMPKMHISTYSLAETFDIGRDTGTQVSKLYDGPFPFDGLLDRVVITLTD